MSSTNTVCGLAIYIKNYHPNFDNLLRNTCNARLTNIKGNQEATFIIPNEASVKAMLVGSEKLSTEKAIKEKQSFCKRHFLLSKIDTVSGSTITNADNKYLSLEKKDSKFILTGNGKSVTLKEADTKLLNRVHKGKEQTPKIIICEQVSGNIGEIEGSDTPSKVVKPTVKGGALYNRVSIEDSLRFHHCLSLLNSNSSDYSNPYLASVNSLLLFLKVNNKPLYNKLILVKDISPEVNFYMFVQPFNKSNHLIDDQTITKWGGSLFEYRMNDLNDLFDNEAKQILQSKTGEIKQINHKNLDQDYKILSNITGLDSDTLKHMDNIRCKFRDSFVNMVPGNITGDMMTEVVKNIHECCKNNLQTDNEKLLDQLLAKDCYCYLNDGSRSGSFPTISNSVNNTLSDHFIDGFEMLGENNIISSSSVGMYGGDDGDKLIEESEDNNLLGGDYGSIF